MGKRPVRKETIASLEKKYEDLYHTDTVYEARGIAGYARQALSFVYSLTPAHYQRMGAR